GKYADTLDECIRNKYNPDDFIQRCRTEGIPVAEEQLHKALYEQLQALDGNNQNGIWARIIKNAFAPIFIGIVDYVAGNPPWVNWENLPEDYRQSTAPLWQSYDLFRHKGYIAKLGGGKDDISILMTYVAHDKYLKEGGRLGFVITQSVFKTKGGGEGFRTLTYTAEGAQWHMPPVTVHDLSDFQPFEGATNRTALFVAGKERNRFQYPVPYFIWTKEERGRISQDDSLQEVQLRTKRAIVAAQPVQQADITSPWLTAPENALSGIQKG
ncbi:unnamed protein product, partial [marine sediment metagenome]